MIVFEAMLFLLGGFLIGGVCIAFAAMFVRFVTDLATGGDDDQDTNRR